MRLILPWPPSMNTYWRHVPMRTRKGYVVRTLLSRKARIYRTKCMYSIVEQCGQVKATINQPVAVNLHLHSPTRRKFDVDNYLKAILDALTHARIWDDDSLVDELHIFRGKVKKDGCVVVDIAKMI